MNRNEFVSTLRNGLGNISPASVEEILYDYREHFDIGLEQGKTEDEISQSLGDPRLIARQYRAEYIVTDGVGAINLSKASGDKVEIHFKKEVKGFGTNIDEIMDQILVKTETEGDELTVSVKVKDNETEDFWHWLSDHYKAMNVSVDFDIKVPENIKDFKVVDGVGDISIEDAKAKIEITDGVGRIKLNNVSLVDECEFTAGTGDIEIDGEIKELSHLSIKSGVGKTNLRLPEDSKFSIDASTGVGSIDGNLVRNGEGFVGDSLVQDVNGGGPDIEIKSGTGDITVDRN
jgi:hypothetical protein